MSDGSTHLSSAPKHVSFSHSVQVIDDSAIEYVDLPPVLIETSYEDDSIMSFTELTESSDMYFGEASMSMKDLYNMDDDLIIEQNAPVPAALPSHHQSDLDTLLDDDDDDNDDSTSEPTSSSSFWLRLFAALTAIGGMVGCIGLWLSRRQEHPVEPEDTVAIATTATGAADKGFLIPLADGGSAYIT